MSKRLESDWPHTRVKVLERDQGKCLDCGTDASLVHHLSYNMFPKEKTPTEKLLSLCSICHRKYHSSPYQGHSGNTKTAATFGVVSDTITIKTNDLISFTEAAKLLGVSRPTIYNLVNKEQLHPVIIGRNRYLLRTEIEGLIDG